MGLSADFDCLAGEHRAVVSHLGKVQRRCSELVAQQASEIERLRGEVIRLRAEAIVRQSALAYAREDLAALRASIPGLPKRIALARRVEALMGRIQELMRDRHSMRATASNEPSVTFAPSTTLANLREKAVLCLGRDEPGADFARRMVEVAGGQFILHAVADRDQDDAALEASLVAADLVICQAGCVSHDAYWRVQDHCRRTGKECVLVDQPRVLDFLRGRRSHVGTDGSHA